MNRLVINTRDRLRVPGLGMGTVVRFEPHQGTEAVTIWLRLDGGGQASITVENIL